MVSVQSDRVSDRSQLVSKNGVTQHLDTGTAAANVVRNAGPLVVDKPVHTGAAAVGLGNGSSGQHAQMQVDVLEVEVDDVAMSAPAADSAGQKRAQSSSSQGSANSRPRGPVTGDDCKDAPTVTESSLSSRPRSSSAHAVLPSLSPPPSSSDGDDRKTNTPPPAAAVNVNQPRGRKVFDYRLAQMIPRIADMNAQSINVEFSLHHVKLSSLHLYPRDDNLGRELIRVQLGLNNLVAKIPPNMPSTAAVVSAIKSAQHIRVFGRQELITAKTQVKNNVSMATAISRQLRIKMLWTFEDVEAAKTATAALSRHHDDNGDHVFTVTPGYGDDCLRRSEWRAEAMERRRHSCIYHAQSTQPSGRVRYH